MPTVFRNCSRAVLVEHALKNGEGMLSVDGALVVNTGAYTGRSPKDKFIVFNDASEHTVAWGSVNVAMQAHVAKSLRTRVESFLDKQSTLYVTDCYAGASTTHRMRVRVIGQRAWHALFARNMFLNNIDESESPFTPDITVFHAPGFKADPTRDGTNSEAAILIDFAEKVVVICGTEYAGEIKKSVFSMLNFFLPEHNVLPMHCSANVDDENNVAIFFGLSGTGKTTLSTDANRRLIGDDEHGWSEEGVFNFEGGCYAKVINLSEKDEPLIHTTTKRFGTILENVVIDTTQRTIDLHNPQYTENTRASYDIEQLPHALLSGTGAHPKHIVMLTCDAFGVLPPIAKLSPAQAMYHFLSGYTARVAGTERGVKEPSAVFSTCFGAPFMPLPASVYAQLLGEKMRKHNAQCWLVNTGWSGGPAGEGKRMNIGYTRAMLNAALSGDLDGVEFEVDGNFKFAVPKHVKDVPSAILHPRATWNDAQAYDETAKKLVKLFRENFINYEPFVSAEIKEIAL